jgi:hypothetical protein
MDMMVEACKEASATLKPDMYLLFPILIGVSWPSTGFLPFSAIYIELYYIFASVWGHKVRLALLHCVQGQVTLIIGRV